MSPTEPPNPEPPVHDTLRELLQDHDVREQFVGILAEEIEARREPSRVAARPALARRGRQRVRHRAGLLPALAAGPVGPLAGAPGHPALRRAGARLHARGALQDRRGDLRQGVRAVGEPAPRHRGGAPRGEGRAGQRGPRLGRDQPRGARGERLPVPAAPAGGTRRRAAPRAGAHAQHLRRLPHLREALRRGREHASTGPSCSIRRAPRPGSVWAICSRIAGACGRPRPRTAWRSGWIRAA